MLENYYKILGIPPGSDEQSIKKAFRALAMKYHPDVNSASGASENFHQICVAYEVLISHNQKKTTLTAGREHEEEIDPAVYEEIIRQAREKAWERAKMKYEKIRAEKEFFENNDWFVFFRYLGNYLALPFAIFLIIIPVYLAITESFAVIFATIFFWVVGIFILSHIYSKRKTWFHPGHFSTTWKDVVNFFKVEKNENQTENCYFSKGKKADSTPFLLTFFKIRNISMTTHGPFFHQVGYDRKYREISIPRSAGAYRLHFIMAFLKPSIFVLTLLFFPTPSVIWRFIFALVLTLIISSLVFLIARTRSKTSWLLNGFMVLKIFVWMAVILFHTTLYNGWIFFTSEFLGLYLLLMLFFLDMILDLILRAFPFYERMYLPLLPQPGVIEKLFKDGFRNFLEIPVWSTLYPFFRWLF